MRHFTIVAGTRPNFIKVSALIHAFDEVISHRSDISYSFVNTGQHYDYAMSDSFIDQLGIPPPSVNFNIKAETPIKQIAAIMIEFEKYLINNSTDLVIVVGDVNSTVASAIAAKKMNIKVAHVEAGIRSGDISMPEEINRIITDSITDYFFTTSEFANKNLKEAGICNDKIYFVGNTMIDTLVRNRSNFIKPKFWDSFGLRKKKYVVLTLHRPINVDDSNKLSKMLLEIQSACKEYLIIFPAHPRLKHYFVNNSFIDSNLKLVSPMSYLEFNYLVENSFFVITDSGGISEETTYLHVPCLTLRDTTERPETVEFGTNILLGNDTSTLFEHVATIKSGQYKTGGVPELWDGRTSNRIVNVLLGL